VSAASIGAASDTPTPSKQTYSSAAQDLLGRVVCVDVEDRNKKTMNVPALVVLPSADDDISLPTKHHLLVRSFRDNKLYVDY